MKGPRENQKTGIANLENVGRVIRELRRQRHMGQAVLGERIGMQPAPICNIENGRNIPSLRTLCRIAEVLDVTADDLLYPAAYLGTPPAQRGMVRETADCHYESTARESAYARLERRGIARVTRVADETTRLDTLSRDGLEQRIHDYLALEDLCGAAKRATIPLYAPLTLDSAGAAQLAYTVRTHCGIGAAIVFDYIELLEIQGLRIVFAPLSDGIESLSFYDSINANAFIVLAEHYNPEKQLFRMVFELANIFQFTNNHNNPVIETDQTRRFSKEFASCFLMPREAIHSTIMQLGVNPCCWSYELLLRIKHRFGVSAEAFAHRLEEIEALDPELRQKFKQRIHAYYAETGFCEPDESRRILSRNGRFGDLLLCARRIHGSHHEELGAIEERFRHPPTPEIHAAAVAETNGRSSDFER